MGRPSIAEEIYDNESKINFGVPGSVRSLDDVTHNPALESSIQLFESDPSTKEQQRRIEVREWLVFICIVILAMMDSFNATVLIPALPVWHMHYPRVAFYIYTLADQILNPGPGKHLRGATSKHILGEHGIPPLWRKQPTLLRNDERSLQPRTRMDHRRSPRNNRHRNLQRFNESCRTDSRPHNSGHWRRRRNESMLCDDDRDGIESHALTVFMLHPADTHVWRHPRPRYRRLVSR